MRAGVATALSGPLSEDFPNQLILRINLDPFARVCCSVQAQLKAILLMS
jgi:hypothetical protein